MKEKNANKHRRKGIGENTVVTLTFIKCFR